MSLLHSSIKVAKKQDKTKTVQLEKSQIERILNSKIPLRYRSGSMDRIFRQFMCKINSTKKLLLVLFSSCFGYLYPSYFG